MNSTNPLSSYFRKVKSYIKLPSNGNYYDASVIEFKTQTNEVGIRAMTAADELQLKNPDALLNGEALKSILLSCVEGLHKPEKLLVNDVEALIIAIKVATYGDVINIEAECPVCNHNNTFGVNVALMFDDIKQLEPEYPVNLSNGLTAFVRPYLQEHHVRASMSLFNQSKIVKIFESDEDMDETKKISMFSKTFVEMSKLTHSLICDNVLKVVAGDDIVVTDKTHIAEMLNNISAADVEKIESTISALNDVGLDKVFTGHCSECNNEMKVEIEFNPVNFSTGS